MTWTAEEQKNYKVNCVSLVLKTLLKVDSAPRRESLSCIESELVTRWSELLHSSSFPFLKEMEDISNQGDFMLELIKDLEEEWAYWCKEDDPDSTPYMDFYGGWFQDRLADICFRKAKALVDSSEQDFEVSDFDCLDEEAGTLCLDGFSAEPNSSCIRNIGLSWFIVLNEKARIKQERNSSAMVRASGS